MQLPEEDAMSYPYLTELMAVEHRRDLQRAAARSRLAAAVCCPRPSRLAAALRRARGAIAAAGPGRRYQAACCDG
jgi:hypothetical protein